MDETEIDLRGIFGLLRRQFRLIAITFILVVGIAGIVTFSLTPVYTSSALIMVDPSRKNLLDPDAQVSSSSSDSARIDSEVEILRSDNVLLKVIAAENLASDEEVGVRLSMRDRLLAFLRLAEPKLPTPQDALNQALNNLRNSISIQRRGLTYLIAVQARSEDPEQAARIANAVAKAYIEDQVASKVNSTLASRDILQARISQAREAIVASEGSFDAYIDQNIARITMDSGSGSVANLQRQIDALAQARDDTAKLASAVETGLETDDFDAVVRSLQNDALTELERQREELAAQLSGTEASSPAAVELQNELRNIETRLRETAQTEVANLQSTVSANQQQESVLREDLRQSVINSNLSPDILAELYELQQNAELARTQYQTLLARTQELETQADLQLADSRLVSPALPSEFASFPSVTIFLVVAGIIAIGLGVTLAIIYENFIGGFTTEAQLASVLKTRVATAVPRQRAKSERESLANLIISAPLSVFSESIRRLRATLDQTATVNTEDSQAKVVMVSSTAPNEGKTTLALALARSYALSGRKVLLVDCDLRKPSIHRHLGIEPTSGLYDFLNSLDGLPVDGVFARDPISSVTVIAGARRSDLPTDQLLTGPYFARMIRAARKTYDVVVIDTPPVGPVVDGLYVAPFADAIVFVTRWASTSQMDARQSVNSLMEAKAPDTTLVAVINQQDVSRASYMRKYGGYYAEVS